MNLLFEFFERELEANFFSIYTVMSYY